MQVTTLSRSLEMVILDSGHLIFQAKSLASFKIVVHSSDRQIGGSIDALLIFSFYFIFLWNFHTEMETGLMSINDLCKTQKLKVIWHCGFAAATGGKKKALRLIAEIF